LYIIQNAYNIVDDVFNVDEKFCAHSERVRRYLKIEQKSSLPIDEHPRNLLLPKDDHSARRVGVRHQSSTLNHLKDQMFKKRIKKDSTFSIDVMIPGVTVKVPTDLKDQAKITLEIRVRDVHFRSDEKEHNKTIETRENETDYLMKYETEVFSSKYKVLLTLDDLEMYLFD